MVSRQSGARIVRWLTIASLLASPAYAGTLKSPHPAPDFPTLEDYYPVVAKRAGQEGAVAIHVCVDTSGRLTEPPRVATSSGNELLDSAGITVASAGSGHYIPGTDDGTPIVACTTFKINFVLRHNDNAMLPDDPRFPIISARIMALGAEYNRRAQETLSRIDRPNFMTSQTPSNAHSLQEIRQYARDLDAYLDLSVSITADFLDDVEYLQKDPGIPEAERAAFSTVWPDERAALASEYRQLVGTARDAVRAMDDLADYLGFAVMRPRANGQGQSMQISEEDPQLKAIRERGRIVMERLQRAFEAVGRSAPAPHP